MVSIRTKLIIFIGLLIVTIDTFSCLFFLTYAKKQQEETLAKLGTSLVMLLAQDKEVRHALNYAQPAFLDTPIKRIRSLDREEEVGYWRIANADTIMLEETSPWLDIDLKEIPVKEDMHNPEIPLTNRVIISSGKTFYDFTIDIFEKHSFSEEEFAAQMLGEETEDKEKTEPILGFIQIGLSSDKLNKRIHTFIRQTIIPIGAGIIVCGVCITLFLTKYIVSPLRHLASITLDIARGNLTRIVNIRTKDEIGQLSMNFNIMTKALKTSYDEKDRIMTQLRDHVDNLFKANAELTKINDQLKDTQERLIRSEKLAAIGKLASGVGHELRNPLSAIKNTLFLIQKKMKADAVDNNQRLHFLLSIVEKETERSIKIINDLLGFSRTVKPAVSPTNVRLIIEFSLSRVKIPEKIKKTVIIEDTLPPVSVDATQIEQVFINILQNACDAMHTGGSLRICAQRENNFVSVAFTDTGCGIPDNIKNKIFDPLFTTKPHGIGLGLALSYNIIQRHGGRIDLKSKEGEGTCFVVHLPISKEV